MSAAMRLPSRMGTITLRSMMATDSNSVSSAVRCATNSGLGVLGRCACPDKTVAKAIANARVTPIFMTEECTARSQLRDGCSVIRHRKREKGAVTQRCGRRHHGGQKERKEIQDRLCRHVEAISPSLPDQSSALI